MKRHNLSDNLLDEADRIPSCGSLPQRVSDVRISANVYSSYRDVAYEIQMVHICDAHQRMHLGLRINFRLSIQLRQQAARKSGLEGS